MPELSPHPLPEDLPFVLKPARQAFVLMGIQTAVTTSFCRSAWSHLLPPRLDGLGTGRCWQAPAASCLAQGQSPAVDGTSLTAAVRTRFLQPARAAGCGSAGFSLRSAVAEPIGRSAKRQSKVRILPRALAASSRKLELPASARVSPASGTEHPPIGLLRFTRENSMGTLERT